MALCLFPPIVTVNFTERGDPGHSFSQRSLKFHDTSSCERLGQVSKFRYTLCANVLLLFFNCEFQSATTYDAKRLFHIRIKFNILDSKAVSEEIFNSPFFKILWLQSYSYFNSM